VVMLLMIPAVRTSAQAFLDLFRVINFVPIEIDPARLSQLKTLDLGPLALLGGELTVLQDPGPPLPVSSIRDAASLAGMDVRVPAVLPSATERSPAVTVAEIGVVGARAARVDIRTDRLREVLQLLGIDDVDVPEEFNGKQVTIRIPPVVRVKYVQGPRDAELFQAQSPTVELPRGLDLPILGEIALRILGLNLREARALSAETDWHSTLLVPVPPDAERIHRIQVGNARANGLAIETAPRENGTARAERAEVVVWSTGDRVYALTGTIGPTILLEMAHSIP